MFKKSHLITAHKDHNRAVPKLGLVPTMGALHNGHKSLIESSIKNNDVTVVSIFVNPTQFSPTEDLAKYPRTLEKDIELCTSLGVDIVFAPDAKEMYSSNDEVTLNPPKSMGYILEGYYRPTHFAGVLQIVLKLFNLMLSSCYHSSQTDAYSIRAYFGKKDAQQLLIVQKMVHDLYLPIEVIAMPIVRDTDSLALSSRNVYLTPTQRQQALALPRAILRIEHLIVQENIRDIETLKAEANSILQGLQIDYMDFYTHNLTLAKEYGTREARKCIFLVAITIDKIRLLDNLWIE
ncbi:pantoate--beta-alanine ligase [Helicobacter sp. MIT 14-3879]|uniref:pantoate--beta-alanine ligase n=1 Tax=Helicobacter sp. MIT 14-3879 TaxID=2040649 RepID=UPI000E1E3F08|nr:pantoate--beta-alanine ligase [Helicobacter sp. MIT 14-3879]RDU61238.1 pantoate--beta-alanine ligase [Helicobacter sp. MIT 14-3879]